MTRLPLPIDPVLPDVVAALRRGPAVVVRAPPGAGKTTRVPPALLDAGVIGSGRILVLEPRRVAARAAARRMAAERGGRLGDEVGYQVRFDRQYGPQTRILVVTPGILLRILQDDPFLESAGAVVFDEFHERGLESDLALGMVRLVQQTVRPDFRIIVMSATLAVENVAAFLGGCPVVEGEGRQYPVEVVYEPPSVGARLPRPYVPAAAARAAERLLDRCDGDLLLFLPGLHEIRQTAHHLEAAARERGLAVLPLYGDLPAEQQDAALAPLDRRKVVLATNVAETSVTVEGVAGVVDTGLARTLTFDPGVGLDRLRLTPISRASADQRAGRAGRTRPGVCVRLWSAASHLGRPEHAEPEIRRVDLAGAVLQLMGLGETDVSALPLAGAAAGRDGRASADAAAATRCGGRTGRDGPRPDVGPPAGPPAAGPAARRGTALGPSRPRGAGRRTAGRARPVRAWAGRSAGIRGAAARFALRRTGSRRGAGGV